MNVIVVDEHDVVIGLKDRDAIDANDIYRASGLWITNSKGEHLLAQRSFTKAHDPGKWGPAVAGTVEEGETYESNIYKEAEEEIGLKGFVFQLGPKVKSQGDHNHHYFGQWFTLLLDRSEDEFVLPPDEVEKVKWFTSEEIKQALEAHPDQFVKAAKRWMGCFIESDRL